MPSVSIISGNTYSDSVLANAIVTFKKWEHIAWTIEGADLRLFYKYGIQVGAGTRPRPGGVIRNCCNQFRNQWLEQKLKHILFKESFFLMTLLID
jgi:hypothetical protein